MIQKGSCRKKSSEMKNKNGMSTMKSQTSNRISPLERSSALRPPRKMHNLPTRLEEQESGR